MRANLWVEEKQANWGGKFKLFHEIFELKTSLIIINLVRDKIEIFLESVTAKIAR
jgi:hypothetical protein